MHFMYSIHLFFCTETFRKRCLHWNISNWSKLHHSFIHPLLHCGALQRNRAFYFFPIPNTHTLNKFLFVASHRIWFCTIDRLAIDFLNIQFWLCLIFLHKNSLPWGLINYSMYGWSVGREGLFFRYQLPFYFSQSYNFVYFLLLLESFWQVLPLYFLHYYY